MSAPQSVQTFGRKKTAVAVAHCKTGSGLIKLNGERQRGSAFRSSLADSPSIASLAASSVHSRQQQPSQQHSQQQ